MAAFRKWTNLTEIFDSEVEESEAVEPATYGVKVSMAIRGKDRAK